MTPGEAARLAKAKREKQQHDAEAARLNATTYSKPAEATAFNPKDKDAPSVSQLLRRRKKPAPTAGDAANALARRKKEKEY